MERFRLQVRCDQKRGHVWELHLFPTIPNQEPNVKDARLLCSCASPALTGWLRQLSDRYLEQGTPCMVAERFGPASGPCWLTQEDGMRMAFAISGARWLVSPEHRRSFRNGLSVLPSEVVLYWFTLCFYGYRQTAGRAAFRTLLTWPDANGETA